MVFVSVPMEVCLVVSLIVADLEVHFGLEPVENPVKEVAPLECCSDVVVFLFQ